jgi:hypothetical protein
VTYILELGHELEHVLLNKTLNGGQEVQLVMVFWQVEQIEEQF